MAHIRRLAVHSPGHKYTQTQLASTLSSFVERVEGGSRWTNTIHSLFRNTKIDTRYLLWDPKEGLAHSRKAEEVMPNLVNQNTHLSSQVISNTLKSCSLQPEDVDSVFFSSPLFSAPAMSIRAMNHLPFRRDVKHFPLMGLGCVGGVALMSRATDYLRAYPKQTALTLTVESGSRFWYGTLQSALGKLLKQGAKENKEKIVQQILLAALFGDAISCTVLHGAESPFLKSSTDSNPGPSVVDYESYLLPDSVDLVSHHVEESGIQSYLSHRLGSFAPGAMADTIDRVLKKNNLKKSDINQWFVHPGGPKMLKYFENEYGLTPHQLRHSWRALAEVGNISSATVPRSYEMALETEGSNLKGGWGVMVAVGPGLVVEVLLLKWN